MAYTEFLEDQAACKRKTERFFTNLLESPLASSACTGTRRNFYSPASNGNDDLDSLTSRPDAYANQHLLKEDILRIEEEALKLKQCLSEAISGFKAVNERIRTSKPVATDFTELEDLVIDDSEQFESTKAQELAVALIPVTLRNLTENHQAEQPLSLCSSIAATDRCICRGCSLF